MADVVQHRPVGEQIVEKEIGKAHKAFHRHLQLGVDLHIRQLGLEPPQLHLQPFHLLLGFVQAAVLGQVHPQAAAHHIPGSPALGAVQAVQHLAGGVQGDPAGVDGLLQLLLLQAHPFHAGLALHQLLGGGAMAGLQFPHFLRQGFPVAAFAAFQLGQPGPAALQVGVDGGQLPRRGVVPDTGGAGFFPLFVQLLLPAADHLVKKRRQAAPFQAVYIGLLGAAGLFQFFDPAGHRLPLGLQLFVFGFQMAFFSGLLPKFL